MLWQALICLPQLFQKFSSGLNVVHGTSTYFRTPILDEGSSICFVAYPPKLRDEPTLRCIIKVQDGKNWSKANSESPPQVGSLKRSFRLRCASFKGGQGWPPGTLFVSGLAGLCRGFESLVDTGTGFFGLRRDGGSVVIVKNNIKE